VPAAGLSDQRLRSVIEAARIDAMIRSKRQGRIPTDPDTDTALAGGTDTTSEAAWLPKSQPTSRARASFTNHHQHRGRPRRMSPHQPDSDIEPTTSPTRAPARPKRWQRLARLLTEVLAPAPIVATLLIVVAWHSAQTPTQALTAGLLAALFASIIPFAYIVRGVRRGQLTDHHVGIREQRRIPLLFGIASVIAGTNLLAALRAPRDLIALIIAMLGGLATSLLVTLRWKISVHTAVAAGASTILTLIFGPTLLTTAPLVAAIAWARVTIGDHSPTQTIAGACLGITVAATIFPTLR
jgi:membrane-associated phospholipid phosphatase